MRKRRTIKLQGVSSFDQIMATLLADQAQLLRKQKVRKCSWNCLQCSRRSCLNYYRILLIRQLTQYSWICWYFAWECYSIGLYWDFLEPWVFLWNFLKSIRWFISLTNNDIRRRKGKDWNRNLLPPFNFEYKQHLQH